MTTTDGEMDSSTDYGGSTVMTIRVIACRIAMAILRRPLCTSCHIIDVAAWYP